MNSRSLDWDRLFMNFAGDVSNMSRAVRLKVGAVAVRNLRVVAIGYNGTPAGEDNCCEEMVETDETGNEHEYNVSIHREWKDNKNWVLRTKSNVIHAEDNLIRFAKNNNIDLTGCVLYITHSPCLECSKKIKEAGFSEIVYGKLFRDIQHLKDFNSSGIGMREWN